MRYLTLARYLRRRIHLAKCMTPEIKQALKIFTDKQPFSFKYLKKNLPQSDNDHKRLTSFLKGKNLIQVSRPNETSFGPEYWYELSDVGKGIQESIAFFSYLDAMIKFMSDNPGSSHSFNGIYRYTKVPNMTGDYQRELVEEVQAIRKMSADKTDGDNYVLTDRGREILNAGGFTAINDREITEMLTEFERNRFDIPKSDAQKIDDLHTDMLKYLKQQDEIFPNEWVDLLAYYSQLKERTVRDVAWELKKEYKWIDIKPVGLTGVSTYDYDGSSINVSFPNPLNAKITYSGKLHLRSLDTPIIPIPSVSIIGTNIVYKSPNSPITDNSIGKSTTEMTTSLPESKAKKDITGHWKLIATMLAVVAGLIKLAEVLGWLG